MPQLNNTSSSAKKSKSSKAKKHRSAIINSLYENANNTLSSKKVDKNFLEEIKEFVNSPLLPKELNLYFDIINTRFYADEGIYPNTKVEIYIFPTIELNNMKKIGISMPPLSPFDLEVHNAVASLAVVGNRLITQDMIFNILTGYTDEAMTSKVKDAIIKSMDALRFAITFDRKLVQYTRWISQSYTIPYDHVQYNINGEVVDFFRLFGIPRLFIYALNKQELGHFSTTLLNTPLRNTTENIALKGYLLRQLKNTSNKMSATIQYDSVCNYIGATSNSILQNIRDKVKILLDCWIEKDFINSYTNTDTAITIYY